ncbi:MAG: hypothetical protein NTZ46_08235 [Verrucomicrobia bacterium]|nr:hypothetical protein [Verrucomicrobiota bacterium]
MEWTQGSGFNFAKGDTFYDTPLAYPASEQGRWSDALKHFRYCIEVTQSSPCVPAKLPPKIRKAAPPDAEDVETCPRYPGRVEFKLFVPNEDKTGLTLRETGIMTQDEFTRLLITGESPKLTLKWAEMLL